MDDLDIFSAALELETPEEREKYLHAVCGNNPALRERIEALLRSSDKVSRFMEAPAAGIEGSPTLDQPITEKPGTQIGPYKLLQQVGEGGMGVVYMAEQKEPVKRRVALKIIKPGMDTRQVIARFEAERQALAMMDHPNIAKVLDAGQTESGRPYFVMELVKGVPVTQYCDEQHLTPRQRLDLFIPICQAVQHAHQKGIIHRDIKPGNILVALFDGQPVPKVIDFGVAKATRQTLTEKTMFTQLGQIVGTLEYMSPEQAQVNQLDIDTRGDVYSLGVVLYELLTGDTPFDRQRLRSAAFDEMLKIIREEEPPKPSTRVSSSETLASVAANRHIEPAKLSSLVRGELDWIVMKALEKDRARRYETASKFAEDVQHYLNDEPVVACPPSAVYKFRKFALRNRGALVTASLLATMLVLGTVISVWQTVRATRALHAKARAHQQSQKAQLIAEAAQAAEAKERQFSEDRRKQADREKQRAETFAEKSRERLVRLHVRRGSEHVENGDYTLALPWFVKALELDHADPKRNMIHRLRVATTLDRCPKLTQVWFPEHPVQTVQFYPDGRRVLLNGGGKASVWNVTSRTPAALKLEGYFAQLSPDGSRIVSFSRPGTVTLLDSDTGKVILQLDDQEQRPRLAGFSRDGGRLFVIYGSTSIRGWDTTTGEAVTPLLTAAARIASAQWSPNGRHLVASENTPSKSDSVVIWDTETGEVVRVPIHVGLVGPWHSSLRVDGNSVAVLADCFVHVASLSDGLAKYPWLQHGDSVYGLQLSSDGSKLLTCCRANSARVWDAKTGEPLTSRLLHGAPVVVAKFFADATLVVTGCENGEIGIWSVASQERVFPLLRHPDRISAVGSSPDARLVLTASPEGGVRIWDLAAAESAPELTRRLGSWAGSVGFSNSGRHVAVGSLDHYVRVYDIETHRLAIPPIRHAFHASFCGYDCDDATILTASSDGTIAKRTTHSGEILFEHSVMRISAGDVMSEEDALVNDDGEAFFKAGVDAWFHPDGKKLLCYHSGDSRRHRGRLLIMVMDARSGQPLVGPLPVDNAVQSLAVTPDNRYVVLGVGSNDEPNSWKIEIRSFDNLKIVRELPVAITPFSLHFSRDGKRLLIGLGQMSQGKGFAQVLDFESGVPVSPPMRHEGAVTGARFFSQDRRILTHGHDGVIRIWNAASGQRAAPDIRVGRRVTALTLQPDQLWLAAGTGANNMRGVGPQYVRFWDLETGEPISPPFPHGNTIGGLSFSADGKRIASTSRDRHLRVWDLPHESRSLSDLQSLVQIVSGIRLDETDTPVVVTGDEFNAIWADLRHRFSDDFTGSPAEQIAWHRHAADQATSSGQFESALDYLGELIELDPTDGDLFRRRIDLDCRLKRWTDIPPDADRIIRLESCTGSELARFALFISTLDDSPRTLNEYALELADKAIDQAHDDPHTWHSRARIHAQLGNWSEANRDFQTAIEQGPNIAGTHSDRGNAFAIQGRLDDAIDCYQKAIELDPKLAVAHYNLGNAFRVQGELDAAMDCWRKAIDLDPIYGANAHNNLGNALATQGKLDEAIRSWRKAIELDPKLVPAHANLANAFRDQGKLDKAINWYRKAIELDPKRVDQYTGLVEALKQKGDWTEVNAVYAEALKVFSKDAPIYNDFAWMLATCPATKHRNPARAVELAQTAVELTPDVASYYNTLGTAYYRAGQWRKAVMAIERSIELAAGDDLGFDAYILAMAQWQLGDRDKAKNWYDKAITWTAENAADDEALTDFRTEAEELTGFGDELKDGD